MMIFAQFTLCCIFRPVLQAHDFSIIKLFLGLDLHVENVTFTAPGVL